MSDEREGGCLCRECKGVWQRLLDEKISIDECMTQLMLIAANDDIRRLSVAASIADERGQGAVQNARLNLAHDRRAEMLAVLEDGTDGEVLEHLEQWGRDYDYAPVGEMMMSYLANYRVVDDFVRDMGKKDG